MVWSSFIQHSPDLRYIKDSGFVNIKQVIPPPSFSVWLYLIYLGYSLGCDISFYILWHFQRFWWHVTQIDSVLRQQSCQWVNCPAVFQITNHSNLQVHCTIIERCDDILIRCTCTVKWDNCSFWSHCWSENYSFYRCFYFQDRSVVSSFQHKIKTSSLHLLYTFCKWFTFVCVFSSAFLAKSGFREIK